jgi:hypothetical protein
MPQVMPDGNSDALRQPGGFTCFRTIPTPLVLGSNTVGPHTCQDMIYGTRPHRWDNAMRLSGPGPFLRPTFPDDGMAGNVAI